MFPMNSRFAARPSRARLMGHASHMPASRARTRRTPAIRETIYDRELEKDQLDRELKERPRNILVVLGPRNCGKSAILRCFLGGRPHVVYVNCRAIDSSSPTTFISGLLQQLLPKAPDSLQQRLKEVLLAFPADAKFSSQEITWGLAAFWKAQGQAGADSTSLNQVFDTLMEIFAAWEEEVEQKPAETYRPVLIIDEANVLRSWVDTHSAQLRSLLRFFVMITKERGKCHVVMATSEFSYPTWLNKEIGPGFWEPQVIGDFPESEARQFLSQLLGGDSSSDLSSIVKDDKAWAAVYEVCGGNAGTLARLAKKLEQCPGRDWEEVLKELWRVELERVARLSRGGEGFSEVHYAAAIIKLLDSEQAQNSVSLPDMEEWLGGYVEGAASEVNAVLDCLVQANALSVRPQSVWARDIPAEAFGDYPLVTAPSTMDLYCMRRIRPQLDKVLAKQANH